jgi:hypothetical protein
MLGLGHQLVLDRRALLSQLEDDAQAVDRARQRLDEVERVDPEVHPDPPSRDRGIASPAALRVALLCERHLEGVEPADASRVQQPARLEHGRRAAKARRTEQQPIQALRLLRDAIGVLG